MVSDGFRQIFIHAFRPPVNVKPAFGARLKLSFYGIGYYRPIFPPDRTAEYAGAVAPVAGRNFSKLTLRLSIEFVVGHKHYGAVITVPGRNFIRE